MKRAGAALLTMIMLIAFSAWAEGTAGADSLEGPRLIGLFIAREDLAAYTDDTGILTADCRKTSPDGDVQYVFGGISGLNLICFLLPGEAGEGSRIVSDVDKAFTAVDFDVN